MLQNETTPAAPLCNREPSASLPILALMTFALGTAFFINEVDWQVSTYEDYALDAEDAESLVATGNSARKICYGSIGLLGVGLLVCRSRQQRSAFGLPLFLFGCYVLTCVASVAWASDPHLAMKRVAILLFCSVGVIGVTRHLSGRNLIDVAILIAAFLIGIGVLAELSLGTFRPWSPDYRFAGTVHPNSQGSNCAILALAAFFGARQASRGKPVYLLLFIVGFAFLVLTKSRTCLAGFLLAAAIAWLWGKSRAAKTFVGIGVPLALCSMLIAAGLVGMELMNEIDSAARLGRSGLESGFGSLNGRGPLWAYLSTYIQKRPLLGYGYHSFWTPERIFEISVEQEWTIGTAHSVFIDVLLNVGFIGGTFFVLAVLISIARTARRCRETKSATMGFVFAMSVFAVLSSIFESSYVQPAGFDSFIAACGVLYAVARPKKVPTTPVAGKKVTALQFKLPEPAR